MRSFLSISAVAGLAGFSSALASFVADDSFPHVEVDNIKHPISAEEFAVNNHVHEVKASMGPRRKTLGFGPTLPSATFNANPDQVHPASLEPHGPNPDPYVVARLFLQDLSQKSRLNNAEGFWIRDDSYTDRDTGITHVYIGQAVQGIPVANAHLNLNIKDGKILSYGSSLYDGSDDFGAWNPPSSVTLTHHEYCTSLASTLLKNVEVPPPFQVQGFDFVPVTDTDYTDDSEPSAGAYQFYADNCLDGSSRYPFWFSPEMQTMEMDPMKGIRPALAIFMMTAAPDVSLRDMIASNLDQYMSQMDISHTSHLVSPSGISEVTMHVHNVHGTIAPVTVSPSLHQVPADDGRVTLVPVLKFIVEMQDNWYEAYVSSSAPHHILSVTDWASDAPIPSPEPKKATYMVHQWGTNDPEEAGRSMMEENYDSLASPVGWHSLPFEKDPATRFAPGSPEAFYRNTTTTWGNNVFAQENWEGASNFIDNGRPDSGSQLVFDYLYDPKKTDKADAPAEAKGYINATVAQLFYTCNMIHDMFYRYGFTEEAGNFQQHNFGRGGRDGDAVIANAQDGSGYNNANFMTPPDGSNGRMRMYLWNTAIPFRDGDMEAGIVIHEYSHGISTRLTGGPANSNCLGWGESGGMGEGWGDFFATVVRSTKTYHDYPMGAWAANSAKGIRNYPYSMNNTVNPSTYKTLDKPGYWGVHAIGEVWAEILYVITQDMISQHGFTETLYPPYPDENGVVAEGDFYRIKDDKFIPKHGNSLMIQLVVNGMKLQPCRPSFFDARDAIIQADEELTGGENFCTLWKGFANRGLGPDARVDGRTPWGGGIRTNDFAMPAKCTT